MPHPSDKIGLMTRRLLGWDYCRPWIYEVNRTMVVRKSCALGQVINGFKIGCNRAARELRPDVLLHGAIW